MTRDYQACFNLDFIDFGTRGFITQNQSGGKKLNSIDAG